jgi:hypothetical protein
VTSASRTGEGFSRAKKLLAPMGAPPPPPAWPPPPAPVDSPYPGAIAPIGRPLSSPAPQGWGHRPPPLREPIGRVHDGVRWYLVALLLQLIIGVVSAAFFGYVLGGFSTTGDLSTSTTGGADLEALVTFLGFLTLILTIVAWLKWRSGVLGLRDSAWESGPAYRQSAESARRDYGKALWSFLSILLASIVFSIGLAAFVFERIAAACPAAGGGSPTCEASVTPLTLAGFGEAVIVFGLVAAVLEFLVYYYASRSLVDSLRPLVGSAEQARLDRGRLAMVVGAALTPVGLLNTGLSLIGPSYLPLAFGGLVTPFLLLYGLYQIYQAYSAWLGRPGPPFAPAPPIAAPVFVPPPP